MHTSVMGIFDSFSQADAVVRALHRMGVRARDIFCMPRESRPSDVPPGNVLIGIEVDEQEAKQIETLLGLIRAELER